MSGVVRNTWSPESYAWAMSLRPNGWPRVRANNSHSPAARQRSPMSLREAEMTTGIPKDTIRLWWRGGRPRYEGHLNKRQPHRERCLTGLHRLAGANLYFNKGGRRQCLLCKREKDKRYGYRKRGNFHPVYNPDKSLAPLHHLWHGCQGVVDLILETYTNSEVQQIFPKGTAAQRTWFEMHSGRKKWLRFDAVDRILSELALNPLSLAQPTYSTTVPEGDPC